MLEEQPYFCRHCKNPVASSTDKYLRSGLLTIRQPVKVECGHCGQKMTWRPLLAKIPIPVPAYPVY